MALSFGLPEMAIEKNVKRILAQDRAQRRKPSKNIAFGRTLPQYLRRPSEQHDEQSLKPLLPDDIRSGKVLFEGICHLRWESPSRNFVIEGSISLTASRSTKALLDFLDENPQLEKPKYLIESQELQERKTQRMTKNFQNSMKTSIKRTNHWDTPLQSKPSALFLSFSFRLLQQFKTTGGYQATPPNKSRFHIAYWINKTVSCFFSVGETKSSLKWFCLKCWNCQNVAKLIVAVSSRVCVRGECYMGETRVHKLIHTISHFTEAKDGPPFKSSFREKKWRSNFARKRSTFNWNTSLSDHSRTERSFLAGQRP